MRQFSFMRSVGKVACRNIGVVSILELAVAFSKVAASSVSTCKAAGDSSKDVSAPSLSKEAQMIKNYDH